MTDTKLLDIFLPYQKQFFLNDKKRKIWISGRQLGKSFTLAGVLCYKALSKKNAPEEGEMKIRQSKNSN